MSRKLSLPFAPWRILRLTERMVVISGSDGEHYTLPVDIAHQLHLDYTNL